MSVTSNTTSTPTSSNTSLIPTPKDSTFTRFIDPTHSRTNFLQVLSKITTPENYDYSMLLLKAYNNLYSSYLTHLKESSALYDEYVKAKDQLTHKPIKLKENV